MTRVIFNIKASTQLSAVTTNGAVFLGRYWILHPNWGINGGSISQSTQRLTTINNIATTFGQMNRFLIAKVKMTFIVSNLESFPILITLLPVPSVSVATYSVSNYSTILSQQPGSKGPIVLNPIGNPGSVKTISITVIPWKLEGFSNMQSMEQASYWNTYAAVGGLTHLVYMQAQAVDGTTTFNTAKGYDVTQSALYTCLGIQTSVTTTL